MNIKKLILRSLFALLLFIAGYGVYYAWRALPIISGYGAKDLCSCVMLAGRNPEEVLQDDLGWSPIRLGTFSVDYSDSSATGSVFGLAKRKAIYRKGLGCSLLVEMSEAEFRSQKMNLAPVPAINQDTLAWPSGNFQKSATLRIDREKLNAVLDSAFSEPGPDKLRKTRAILVVYKDNLIAERYADGFTKDTRFTGWSMTKSITNALVGILVKQGRLKVNEPAPIASWKNDDRKNITLNDLLHANSGLQWVEDYGNPSGATNMLYKKKDMGLYAAESGVAYKPGEVWYYSSGTTNIISRIIREAVGDNDYYKFPYEELMYKIGMLHTTIEPDAGGTFVGSSYCFGTARDWARFGLLYLHDGVWNDERILPEGWVKYTTTPAAGTDRGQYGAQFWLNAGGPGKPENRFYPSVPTDLFWADGFEGQNVFILPSKDLVVVKLSLTHGNALDDDEFLAGIIEVIK